MISKILTSAAALAALSSVAMAADLPNRREAPPAPVLAAIAPFSWTGFYVGAQAGYAWGSSAETFTLANTAAANFSQSYSPNGGMIGGVVGFNYQIGSLVLGIENENNWSKISGASGVINVGPPNLQDTYTTRLNWYGALKGRVGFAADRALIYVNGGLAYGETRHAYLAALNGGAGNTFYKTDFKTGWTIGGGVEYAFTKNWTGRVEYNYFDLGRSTINYGATRSNWRDTYSVVKVGLNYIFDWGSPAGAVVARY